MATSRNIIVAGAGIGGLTAALALARCGFRVTLIERAGQIEEAGAGIQLSPNATRVLISLGLADRLRRTAVTPQAVVVNTASGGRLARIPLGNATEARYGAPYWSIHRGDLQAALLDAVRESPDIALRLGTSVDDFVVHAHGVSAACRNNNVAADEHGIALVCADGLWSGLRHRLGQRTRPEFRGRTAWRALLHTERAEPAFRAADVQLWLGRDAHLVHYPVKSGALINIVAIVNDRWSEPGWTAEGAREDLLACYSAWNWAEPVRAFLALPLRWQKWALYDLPPLRQWGDGPVTLLGDAAHPMLPFLAQGAAMAIEDAAVLAACLSQNPDDPAAAMRHYERARRPRTARVQRAARSNGRAYHLGAAEAAIRNFVLRVAGGSMLLRRYDWLYDWRAPAVAAAKIDMLPSPRAGEGERDMA
ncbi:MAG: FAD-binding protein [Alphaproteobacteria bacterium]|nr:FAD-binding protein [Alphaproteobacteria bacterium]